ncbi:MAG: GNAT family N-acetyltransferase [Candidatus Bathyarchaeota archaeon]
MGTDVKIKIFEEKNLTEVIQINLTCLPENYSESFYLDIHKNFPKTFLVATADEKVVGYIMCRVEVGFSDFKRFKLGKKAHVISLAVLSEYRGQGIASDLLLNALRNISEGNVDECYLECRAGNKQALNLYKRYEFKTIRTLSAYYRDGEDAYLMSKTTASS